MRRSWPATSRSASSRPSTRAGSACWKPRAAARSSCSAGSSARTGRRGPSRCCRGTSPSWNAPAGRGSSWPRTAAPPTTSRCARCPSVLQDRCLGGIVLEVASVNVSFEGSDRQFLDALASEMAVALDRTRLLERERERQREEKERLEAEVTDLRLVLHGSRLAYRSPSMESLLATARKIARTDTTVLITGESGTGKEMLAHTVHELSGRRDKPVVVVDCGAIAPTLIESELFGHEKGAFTGGPHAQARPPRARRRRHLFLDEIGELPLDLQAKLLRFVQEKQFTPRRRHRGAHAWTCASSPPPTWTCAPRSRRASSARTCSIASTSSRCTSPPLRERAGRHPPPGDDLPAAVRRALPAAGASLHRAGGAGARGLSWPGNVRELQNLIMTSVLFCDAAEVDVADLHGFQAAVRPGGAGAARAVQRARSRQSAPPPPDAVQPLRRRSGGQAPSGPVARDRRRRWRRTRQASSRSASGWPRT